MAEVDYYENLLRKKRNELARQQEQQRSLMGRAQEIGRIYDQMAREKKLLREKRDQFKAFHKDRHDRFRGNVCDKRYKSRTVKVLDGYDRLLNQVDENLDALNRERMRCENSANDCMGVIGTLKSGINYLYRTIQNMVN